jgi:hypothetical protein
MDRRGEKHECFFEPNFFKNPIAMNIPPKPDWQIVTICYGFVIEVNCNGGGHRRTYTDGRVVYE